ncbi:sensor histidine kinase [Inmirania thermothiophila]|uniref:histidine kinase n=1 Tax=Inmirania thermothiophila TaxID=1750597 RepID=A0A3N1Y320_9GAMM|nr:HAMP domain-containing sensor histidine kinase [Inmirania thermothiophila]ROR32908.1 HAMP domain-containing protein [Inmirania thermothiophila]
MVPMPEAERRHGSDRCGRRVLRGLSLRSKGLIVFFLVVAYTALVAAFALHEKQVLLSRFMALQQLHEREGALRQADLAEFRDVVALFLTIDHMDAAARERVQAHLKDLVRRHATLVAQFPEVAPALAGLGEALSRAVTEPSHEGLLALRRELERTRLDLRRLADDTARRQRALAEEYRVLGNRAALASLLLGVVGVALFGAVTGAFFTRLTRDLRLLQRRAVDIVRGYRGPPIPVRRADEVGQLQQAVNQMALELDERERALELERRKYFQQEKMAAIGSLAAGIVHEIGNPIAAISGLVQASLAEGERLPEAVRANLELILQQTERLSALARDVSDFSTPRAGERQVLDLNGLVRTTVRLMQHDRRFKAFGLRLELDPALPAVDGFPDQLTQVVMNLLINAADAVEEAGRETPEVCVRTRLAEAGVVLEVADNGVGMDAATVERAPEAFFTTKPPGRGTGLGLSLCYAIVRGHEGSLEIESEPGRGTTVRVVLPPFEAAPRQVGT